MAQPRGRMRDRLQSRYRRKTSLFYHDLTMMSFGFVFAFLFSIAVFEILNFQFHWIGGQKGGVVLTGLHGAADTASSQETSGPGLLVSAEKKGPAYAVPGQNNVQLLAFSISPASDGFVHTLTFKLDDLAHGYDLKGIKLYLGNQSLGEVSFFEGRGSFNNLMIKLTANQLMEFTVTGTLSDQAQAGDRLILKLDDNDIKAADANGSDFAVLSDGAVQGPAVSVVHGR